MYEHQESKFTVNACYNAELNLWTGGLPDEYLLTKEAAARVFDGEVSIDDLQSGRDYIPQSTTHVSIYEIDQLRAALEVIIGNIRRRGTYNSGAINDYIETLERVITEVQTALD